jgi:hypothetical protein
MSRRLIALSFSLVLCGAAAAAIAATTAAAQAPARNPVQLAQANDAGRGRAFNRPTPTPAERRTRRAAFCQEVYARSAGRFAYLEARLGLTAAQNTAFARWRDLRLAAAKRRAADCANRPMPNAGAARGAAAPNPVERLTREEARLQRRLADIQAERPALDALYNSLNPGQRRTLAQARGFGGGRLAMGGRMGPRLAFGGGNRMFRRGGPMRGPQGPGTMPPPADAPPPQ